MSDAFSVVAQYLLSTGGIFGLLFLLALGWIAYKEYLGFRTKKDFKESEKKILKALDELKEEGKKLEPSITKEIHDLWEWHSVFDDEGVPIWYVRKSLNESIDNLETTVDLLHDKFVKANDTLKSDLLSKLQKINDARVIELKFLLETYNKTITDLIVTLEKIKTILKSEQD